MYKICIITANFGNFNKNLQSLHIKQKTKHVLDIVYLDDTSFPWRTLSLHPRMRGKIPKFLGYEYYPGYDYYIWLDSNITLNNENTLEWCLANIKEKDLFLFEHPFRNTLKEEFDFMIDEFKKNNIYLIERYGFESMLEQYARYKDLFNDKLYIGGVFMYSKNLTDIDFFKDWFYECARYSVQDQLSLPYVIDKHLSKNKLNSSYWNFFQDSTYFKLTLDANN